jgi:hypothetical protein
MAKRFIDTGLFDDEWFAELSKDGKLFWLYYLTKCDHAGLLKYNVKLIEFQTGIKSIETVRQELANRLITVTEQLLFCPKFISFQYPNFPHSKAPQTLGAISLLQKNGLMDSALNFIQLPNSYLTVKQDLTKSYGNGNDKGDGNDKGEIQQKTKLEIALSNLYEMRVKMRKPATDVAKALIIKELEKLAPNNEALQIEIVEQSIRKGWQDVHPLKTNGFTKTVQLPANMQDTEL